MINSNDGLVLHFKLDNKLEKTNFVLDSSGLNKHGKANDGVSLLPDDTFGACLSFDGTKGEVTEDPSRFGKVFNTFSMMGWVIPTRNDNIHPESTSGSMGTKGQMYMIFPAQGKDTYGGPEHAGVGISVGKNGVSVFEHSAAYLPPLLVWEQEVSSDAWTHIAVVYKDRQPSLYINGEFVKTVSPGNKAVIHPSAQIGGGQWGHFPGKIAAVRVYDKALTEADIKQVINNDKLVLPAYRKGHPIDFSLLDKDLNAVLYISDDPKEDHKLKVELKNTSTQAIQFQHPKGEGAEVSKENYHFELVFRPGTLSTKTLDNLHHDKAKIFEDPANWDMAVSDDNRLDQPVRLYFLYKGSDKDFNQNQLRSFVLQNITAAAGSGARGTRVELHLNQLSYADDPSPITGSRVQNLHITNHLGRKTIPLHVGFVGASANRILNDGSPNELKLHITNTSRESLSLEGASFTFSFDAPDPTQEWAICTNTDLKNIKIQMIEGEDLSSNEGRSNVWEWRMQDLPNELNSNEHLAIELTDIRTNLPTGYTNLYVNYSVPGYWDGQFVCVIEKTPLLFYHVRNSGDSAIGDRVGIGTLNPKNKLDVKGGVAIGATYAGTNQAPQNGLLVEGNVYIGGTSTDRGLYVGPDKSVRLELGKSHKLSLSSTGSFEIDAPKIEGGRFIVTNDGNVGIGNSTPQNLFHVGSGTSAIEEGRVNVVIASKTGDAGIAIAQNNGVNVILQASGTGGYIGTTSNHPLVLRTNDKNRLVITNDGPVVIYNNLILHAEGITNKDQAEAALVNTTSSIVFFVDITSKPHLNWGFTDSAGSFHHSYAS